MRSSGARSKTTLVACRFTHKLDEIVLSIVIISHRGVPDEVPRKFAWNGYRVCWRRVFFTVAAGFGSCCAKQENKEIGRAGLA